MEETKETIQQEEMKTDAPAPEAEAAEDEGKKLLEALAKAIEAEAKADAAAKAAEEKAAQLAAKLELTEKREERLQADFDNFRRRTRAAEADAKQKMTADVVKEFLPVLDNFHLALSHLAKDKAGAAYAQGFEMLQKQLEKTIADLGVTEIEAEGTAFDPHFHEAVMQVPNPDLPDESVAAVFQKGYKLGELVIRPAKVQVVSN